MVAFDTGLRKLAVHCSFEDALQDTLHDHFVCGLRYEVIQRQLLSETSLTYNKELEIAKPMRTADENTKVFKRTDAAVQRVGGGYS